MHRLNQTHKIQKPWHISGSCTRIIIDTKCARTIHTDITSHSFGIVFFHFLLFFVGVRFVSLSIFTDVILHRDFFFCSPPPHFMLFLSLYFIILPLSICPPLSHSWLGLALHFSYSLRSFLFFKHYTKISLSNTQTLIRWCNDSCCCCCFEMYRENVQHRSVWHLLILVGYFVSCVNQNRILSAS